MNKSLKDTAIAGVAWVGIGRVASQFILTGGNILLARIFTPEIFGAFSILSFVIGLVGLIANFSFGQTIVQAPNRPDKNTITSMFWFQTLLGLGGWLVVLLIAPWASAFYGRNLNVGLGILGGTLLLTNLRVIPSFLLERDLHYTKVVLIEVAEVGSTQIINLWGAISGWGVMSFVWGAVGGKMIGWAAAVIVGGWMVGRIRIDLNLIKQHLQFSGNLQITTVLGYLNSALVPVYAAKQLGVYSVGILGWAGGIALGLRMVADVVARVTFPVVAKVQQDEVRLKKTILRAMLAAVGLSWPVIIGFMLIARPVLGWLYTSTWLAGLPIVRVYLVYALAAVVETMITRIVLAIGQAAAVRNSSLISMGLTWTAALVLVPVWGAAAVPVAQMIGSMFVTLWLGRRLLKYV